MIRKIIKIDQSKCNGCGICADACHEGAIVMENGKAKLNREDYCDGLGDCLPACPTKAISFEVREAPAYDEAAVKENQSKKMTGCPGSKILCFERQKTQDESSLHPANTAVLMESQLNQWPIQIKLVPENASFFQNADLLIAADCTAFAYADFHNQFMRNHVTLIGCPKLDEVDYRKKLTVILKNNEIKRVTIVRMEVPCCSGIVNAAIEAMRHSSKMIPWQVVTISTDGRIIEK